MGISSLYNIAAEHRQMVDRMMSIYDADQESDAGVIADTIEAESYPLETKAQSIGYVIKNMEALVAAIKSAEQDMASRRKKVERRIEHLRDYMLTCLGVAGVHKIDGPHFTIAVRNNPPSVDIFNEALLPKEFVTQSPAPPPVPNKAAIRDAIKAGVDVPGATLVQSKRLEIK